MAKFILVPGIEDKPVYIPGNVSKGSLRVETYGNN